MYCSRYTINRASAASVASSQTSGMNLLKTSKLNQSTEGTLLSRKRERGGESVPSRTGKRRRSTVKRYVPECKKFLDDKSEEEEGEVDLSADSGLEERSDDSDDSEGSLREFIVNDEDSDEEDQASSCDSGAKERELSEGETSCESEFSVYSD